jgi:hypothetical protein
MKTLIIGLCLLSLNVNAGKMKDLYIKTVENVEISLLKEGLKVLEIKNVGFSEEESQAQCDFTMSSQVSVMNLEANIQKLACNTCIQNGEKLEALETVCK